MARMLSKTSIYTWGCGRPNNCCRLTRYLTHRGNKVGRLRKVQRAKEKSLLRREYL